MTRTTDFFCTLTMAVMAACCPCPWAHGQDADDTKPEPAEHNTGRGSYVRIFGGVSSVDLALSETTSSGSTSSGSTTSGSTTSGTTTSGTVTSLTYDTGLSTAVGAAHGYSFGRFALESELALRDVYIDALIVNDGYSTASIAPMDHFGAENVSLMSLSVMINGWIHQDIGRRTKVFAGGGIGYANARFHGDSDIATDALTTRAKQWGGGALFRLNHTVTLGLSMRRFTIDDVPGGVNTDAKLAYTSRDALIELVLSF